MPDRRGEERVLTRQTDAATSRRAPRWHGSLGREPGWSRPRVQISVVVANIRTRPSKTEVEKGSVPTAVEHGSVGPKTRAKVFPKGAGSVSNSCLHRLSCDYKRPASRRKGIGLIFPNPDSERARGWRHCLTALKPLHGRTRGDASEPEDVAGSPGKSSLFFVKDHVRGIGSSGDTEKVPVERRGSGGVRCAFGGPGKFGSGFRSSRAGPYPPSAAGLQGVQPLVDGINVGKGSRQNGSVPSEEGLAPRTGSVGP